ncbi:hypothetical protein [Flexibacterium corallicola]|uniref:hypothetical protein n=1 Tax=Flexibacterium corallicola TaxID=3037259 RepID=UPI00286F136A|nr:hypothetical protein [Pseudovibrio sp. M1P-2-3]
MPFFLIIDGTLSLSRTSDNLPIIQQISFADVVFVVYQLYAHNSPNTTSEYVLSA